MDIRISEYQVAGYQGNRDFDTSKDCLSKKERTTCIGNGNSGENPKRFNLKRARKRDKISTQSYLALGFLCKAKRLRKLLWKWLYKDGVLCLIFQSYDLILIEEATGTSYNGRNSLFPARNMRGQCFPFYGEPRRVHHHKPYAVYGTDYIIIVRQKKRRIMTLDKASKIVKIWGIYLEYMGGKLNLIFGACIPESFLPFPIETLEEALNTVAEHHHNMGNKDGVKALDGSFGALTGYKDDEEAVLQAAKLFNDPKWREAMLPVFKKFRKDWIKTQGDF